MEFCANNSLGVTLKPPRKTEFEMIPPDVLNVFTVWVRKTGSVHEAEIPERPGDRTKAPGCFWQQEMLEMNLHTLHLCSSKCAPWTSSISITWMLVQDAESQARPSPTESEPAFQ